MENIDRKEKLKPLEINLVALLIEKEVIILCKCKYGNPKKKSEFICLKCLDWKFTYIQGIQRVKQREIGHIKDNICNRCGEVKTMEVRHCDYLPDIMKKAIRKHNEIYSDNITKIETDFYGVISI